MLIDYSYNIVLLIRDKFVAMRTQTYIVEVAKLYFVLSIIVCKYIYFNYHIIQNIPILYT